MSATRSRKEELVYKGYLKTLKKDLCVFCEDSEEVLAESEFFKVIRNIFAYSIWDGQKVVDHLLIVPKNHTDRIAHFTDAMIVDMHKLMSQYEEQGYNIYARAPASKIKSVVHQHTHLIKTEGAAKKFIFLLRKPYVRFVAG